MIAIFSACGTKAENYYKVAYLVTDGGSIEGEAKQTVKSGEDAEEVTAVPHEGYYFIEWSDGLTEATRQDKAISEDLTVTAIFGKSIYSVTYLAGEGGTIRGVANQYVTCDDRTEVVTAVPNAGYYFVQWSDGVKTAERHDSNILSDFSVTAEFKKIICQVNFIAGEHGDIEGEIEQFVEYGGSTTTVVAVAEYGYRFVKWSDGVYTAERKVYNLKSDITLTAYFELIATTFTYDYKLATDNCFEKSVTLEYFDFKEFNLVIPLREHFTFGGWYLDDVQISDSRGNILVGYELFDSEQTVLTAKWTANETFTFKVLVVYVTEFSGDIPTSDQSEIIFVNYKMSEIERKICNNATILLKRNLDDLLDGLVNFHVDEYYTTRPLGSENLSGGRSGDSNKMDYYIGPQFIPEVSELLADYDSVLSCFSFNDFENKFNSAAGAAGKKYGWVRFESLVAGIIINNEPLENLLDLNYWRWNNNIATFIHEMIHTIELRINTVSWHHTISVYLKKGQIVEPAKEYLLNCAEVDGEIVGIPYEFWKGDVATVTYWAEGLIDEHTYTMGYIVGEMIQEVVYGWDTREVTAIAAAGYEFVEWSDGVKTATRIDRYVNFDFTVTALFRKID